MKPRAFVYEDGILGSHIFCGKRIRISCFTHRTTNISISDNPFYGIFRPYTSKP